MVVIPARLKECTRGYFGADADVWLKRLPQLVAEAVERWELELGDVSETAGTGLVCFATRGGKDVVLKIAYPHGEHFTGVEAMRVYGGPGMCVGDRYGRGRLAGADGANSAGDTPV